jgi:hypothetical protein
MIYDPETLPDPYDPRTLRERGKGIIQARDWGINLVFGVISTAVFLSEAKRILGLKPDPLNYAYLFLLVLTGLLMLLWFWATHHETDIWCEWLDPKDYQPPSDLKETAMIIGLGLLLAALLFTSRDPLLYCLVFSLYSLLNLGGVILLHKELAEILRKSKNRLDASRVHDKRRRQRYELYRNAIRPIEHYHFGNPHTRRNVLVLVASLIALGLSVHWKISGSVLTGMASYVTISGTIMISEWILAQWRASRDDALRPLRAELSEMLRKPEK